MLLELDVNKRSKLELVHRADYEWGKERVEKLQADSVSS